MSGPGKGRYTDYVGNTSTSPDSKLKRLHRNFNNNPMTSDKGNSRGLLYGSTEKNNTTNNSIAAFVVVENYVDKMTGDFPGTVYTDDGDSFIYYKGEFNNPLAPDTKNIDVNVGIAGAPANPYMPDLTSPGANQAPINQDTGYGSIELNGQVNFDKPADEVNEIPADKYKPYLIISPETIEDRFTLGTVSPHVSSPIVGTVSLGSEVTMGSSIKK